MERAAKHDALPPTTVEQRERDRRRVRLEYQRQALLRRAQQMTDAFDNMLLDLRREKAKLDGDLKVCELKFLLLYKELQLLKEFEKKDVSLQTTIERKMIEKNDFVMKVRASASGCGCGMCARGAMCVRAGMCMRVCCDVCM